MKPQTCGWLSFVVLSVSLLSTSCAFSRTSHQVLVVQRPNLHVSDLLTYPDSPLGPLITEFLPDPTARNDAESGTPHAVTILNIGEDALMARIHLARMAKRAIYVQTFIWADDETGRYLMHELIEAAKRGVKVKIISDQMLTEYDPARTALAATAHPNLEIKHYNPLANRIRPALWHSIPYLLTHFKRYNQRMHNKVFIIDDRIAIIGGRNIDNHYYDLSETHNFKDRDVLVVGPVVKDITEVFTDYWMYERSVPSAKLSDVGALIRKGKYERHEHHQSFASHPLLQAIDSRANDPGYVRTTLVDRAFRVQHVEFVADKPGKNVGIRLGSGGRTTERLVALCLEATRSLTLQTPYLVLDHGPAIIKKLQRQNPDIDIRVITNSLAASDSITAYAFTYKQKKRMVKQLGVKIFEMRPIPGDIQTMMPRYTPAPGRHMAIHAKSYVIDHEIVWIGSFNLDPRSANLNTEDGLIIKDRPFAQAVEANILQDAAPQNSWTIGYRKQTFPLGTLRSALGNILEAVPFIDIWRFKETGYFTLREGEQPIAFNKPGFHERYDYVGTFPEASLGKQLRVRLLKVFLGFIRPLV